MNLPSDAQRELMRQLVGQGGDLAPIVDAQFACCKTAAEDHCLECFSLKVADEVPLLPPDTESPLYFDAETPDGRNVTDALQVLLWHANGKITGIEISSVTEPHPAVSDLRILASR